MKKVKVFKMHLSFFGVHIEGSNIVCSTVGNNWPLLSNLVYFANNYLTKFMDFGSSNNSSH